MLNLSPLPGISIICTIVSISAVDEFMPTTWNNSKYAMVLVDGLYRSKLGEVKIDTFFDRVVSIAIHLNQINPITMRRFMHESIAVWISDDQLLTSFNPLRKVALDWRSISRFKVWYVISRLYSEKTSPLIEHFSRYEVFGPAKKIYCGRQVVPPMPLNSLPRIDMRHGRNVPLNDLFVLRVHHGGRISFPPEIPEPSNSLEVNLTWSDNEHAFRNTIGPVLTHTAEKYDLITDDIKFASLGHVNARHIRESRYLESVDIPFDDDVIVDCYKWIPPSWGYFICLNNVNEYPALSAGALLFSENKLFGVGAFVLWKGTQSILVFTDVRPYKHLLSDACSIRDQIAGSEW